MTINHVLDKIKEITDLLDNIDFTDKDGHSKAFNQKQIHEAYNKLNSFRDECLREKVLYKQRRKKGNDDHRRS